MLTRLKISGFKNLEDVDIPIGPFLCIAGPNGVGKSNLFDAISFLSALAERPLLDAALSVRGGAGRLGDVRGLFRRTGDIFADKMSFSVEMIIPQTGEDRLGQPATASMTYLRYNLNLRYCADTTRPLGRIEIVSEHLDRISQGIAFERLGFPHKPKWRKSVVQGRRTVPYISTKGGIVHMHADAVSGKGGGQAQKVPAAKLPRTMLSSADNAVEHRTALLARQEMMSWTQLHLEPSAIRAPDAFTAPSIIGPNGQNMPATLYSLARLAAQKEPGGDINLYARIANRLSELVEQVRSVKVDVDEKRQLLSVVLQDSDGTPHLAGALSDGTLRFLALAVMLEDPSRRSLICMEEPENGMHPARIPAMLRLLQDLAVDVSEPVDTENPLRQVIINTHSPSVIANMFDDDLLVAELVPAGTPEQSKLVRFSPLPNTWRTASNPNAHRVSRGHLASYLSPFGDDSKYVVAPVPRVRHRVKERKDLAQLFFPFLSTAEEGLQ